jgi:hypothetical protein
MLTEVAGKGSPSMGFRLYSGWDQLPAGYAGLFAHAGAADFWLSRPWFETLGASILAGDGRLAIAALETDGPAARPRACLVGRHRERDPAFFGARSFTSLANYYTPAYAPLVDGSDPATTLAALARGLRACRPRYAVVHLQPLAAEVTLSDDLAAALRAAGYVTRRYLRFANWHEDTRGLSFADYLVARPGMLRHTFRRGRGCLERAGALRVVVVAGGAELDQALDRYEQVYAASWKGTEPYPAFIRGLSAALAAAGALRLAFLELDGRPIAAQLWIIHHGTATQYKLAHERALDTFSPGTVLTMAMLERLLDEERITALDLGLGDEPYKRLWASRRRARIGLLGFDPLTPRGSLGILRHAVWPRFREACAALRQQGAKT